MVNEGQAHVTFGGYSSQDYTGDIDWFDMSQQTTWTVNMKNFTLGSYNLLEAPASTNQAFDEQNKRLLDDADPFYTYGHFNTGYPFLGVDEAAGDMIQADLQKFIPNIQCTYDQWLNPWDVCYNKDPCDPSVFNGATMTFSFGGDSMFTMPLSAFMIDYTFGNNYCYIGIQKMKKMSRHFDSTTERHFYFGDVFFKQFIGIFDQGT